jgi:hypothetical protein
LFNHTVKPSSSSTQVISFQKSNSIQEKLNDDDIHTGNREEGGIDEQEDDSLTQTKKSAIKKKSMPVKRKSSSEATKLPLQPPTLRSNSKNGKDDSVHRYQCIHQVIMYLFHHTVRPNSSQQIAQSTVKISSVTTALAGPSGLSGKKTLFLQLLRRVHTLFIIGVQ